MNTLTPLRIDIVKMITAPHSCTGWSCVCPKPYGFGEGGNRICRAYGPSTDVDPVDLDIHIKTMAKKAKIREATDSSPIGLRTRIRMMRHMTAWMNKKRAELDQELDFEDRCRTQEFFDARRTLHF